MRFAVKAVSKASRERAKPMRRQGLTRTAAAPVSFERLPFPVSFELVTKPVCFFSSFFCFFFLFHCNTMLR